jgi:hypothetical protein
MTCDGREEGNDELCDSRWVSGQRDATSCRAAGGDGSSYCPCDEAEEDEET